MAMAECLDYRMGGYDSIALVATFSEPDSPHAYYQYCLPRHLGIPGNITGRKLLPPRTWFCCLNRDYDFSFQD